MLETYGLHNLEITKLPEEDTVLLVELEQLLIEEVITMSGTNMFILEVGSEKTCKTLDIGPTLSTQTDYLMKDWSLELEEVGVSSNPIDQIE